MKHSFDRLNAKQDCVKGSASLLDSKKTHGPLSLRILCRNPFSESLYLSGKLKLFHSWGPGSSVS